MVVLPDRFGARRFSWRHLAGKGRRLASRTAVAAALASWEGDRLSMNDPV
jgi:hypothetical protein